MAELAAKDADEHVGNDVGANAPPLVPTEPAIDLAHLTRMTHGEPALEREVLQLYATQADILLNRILARPIGASAAAGVAALAHTLNGSSRGIGAWEVAGAAAAIEAEAAAGRDLDGPVERLAGAIRSAQRHIAELLRE
jgi:HPt (histidine-containing phosphotransfer) domain-containing protein